jgi:acetyl-CoA acetyltransferase
MWARRYMIETGATELDLAAVAMSQREYAATNPRAMIRKPLSIEDYLAAPFIVDPYRIPDCTVEVDGACAIVVTSLDRARKLPHRPAVIAGGAYVCGPRSGLDIGDILMWDDFSRNFTSHLAGELWESAGLEPKDMDFAEIYDCFTSTVLMGLEGLGFADRGEAGRFLRSRETSREGSLPLNTGGGLLCEGYLHGMNPLVEAVLQLQGRAANQLERADTCVVTSGGLMDGSALILAGA